MVSALLAERQPLGFRPQVDMQVDIESDHVAELGESDVETA